MNRIKVHIGVQLITKAVITHSYIVTQSKEKVTNKVTMAPSFCTFSYKFILTPTISVRNHVDWALSDRALMRWRLALIPTDTPSSPSSLSTLTPRAGNVCPWLSTPHYSCWFGWSALQQVRTLPWLIGSLQDCGHFGEFLMKVCLKALPSLVTEQPSLWTRHSNTKWHIPRISRGWKITLQGKRRYYQGESSYTENNNLKRCQT